MENPTQRTKKHGLMSHGPRVQWTEDEHLLSEADVHQRHREWSCVSTVAPIPGKRRAFHYDRWKHIARKGMDNG